MPRSRAIGRKVFRRRQPKAITPDMVIGPGVGMTVGLAGSQAVTDTAAKLPGEGLVGAAATVGVLAMQVRVIKESGIWMVQTRPGRARGTKGWRTRSRHFTQKAANAKARHFSQ